jgi:hypothetical protein
LNPSGESLANDQASIEADRVFTYADADPGVSRNSPDPEPFRPEMQFNGWLPICEEKSPHQHVSKDGCVAFASPHWVDNAPMTAPSSGFEPSFVKYQPGWISRYGVPPRTTNLNLMA